MEKTRSGLLAATIVAGGVILAVAGVMLARSGKRPADTAMGGLLLRLRDAGVQFDVANEQFLYGRQAVSINRGTDVVTICEALDSSEAAGLAPMFRWGRFAFYAETTDSKLLSRVRSALH